MKFFVIFLVMLVLSLLFMLAAVLFAPNLDEPLKYLLVIGRW